MLIENQIVKVKWNGANKKHYESCGYNFTKINDEFEIDIKHITKGNKSLVKFSCDECDKIFERKYFVGIRNEHQFCTHECSVIYSSREKLSARPKRNCEWCNVEYSIPHYASETSRFCSRECLSKWQSEAFKGNGSKKYVDRIKVNCSWCNNELERTPSYLKNRTYIFCDDVCKRTWHKEVFVKSDKFIETIRKVMINNLTEGKISFTNSKPQVIINDLLKQQGILFENEYPVGDFSFDVLLEESDLLIEVNGGFWHCDNRFYDEINYDIQLNRIISDKRKRTFTKNKLKKNILYLWEFDIETDLELCSQLIDLYIKNNGKLNNYHSFNYSINDDGILGIISDKIIPYMDMSPENIAEVVNLEVRKNVNRFQPDKHITFNCEYCDKEKTQPITTYIRAKNHFCSVRCKNLSQQIGNNTDQLRFKYQCCNCSKDLEVPNHIRLKMENGEQKNIFCSQGCRSSWESKHKIGKNNPLYSRIEKKCQYCGKSYEVPLNQKERNKFCSVECRQQSTRNRIVVRCLNCGTDVEKTPTDIKKNKNGKYYCSHKCSNEHRSKSNKVTKKCEICDGEFSVRKSLAHQRFCSIQCQGNWQSAYLVGENANNYKHGGNIKN